MTSLRHPILEPFLYGRAIPLIHLIEQFLNPGIKDCGAKKTVLDEKDHPVVAKPLFTRDEAYSRLRCRLIEGVSDNDHASCKDYLQKLSGKWNLRCSSNEKLILGLAYEYGLGGIPQDHTKAQEQFKLASNKDRKNSYAHVFTVENLSSEELERGPYLWFLHHSGDNGLTYAFHGIGSSQIQEHLQEYFKKSAALQNYLGTHHLGCMYATNPDDAQKAQGEGYLKAAIAQGHAESLAAYAKYYIKGNLILKIELLRIALQYGCDAENLIYVAKFYRLIFFLDQYKLNRDKTIDAQNQLLLVICNYDALLSHNLSLSSSVLYHYALISRDIKKMHQILNVTPQVFAKLWMQDYTTPSHPKMKEQAIAFVLTICPSDMSIETNYVLGNTLANCSEENLKNKAKEFSLEHARRIEKQQKLKADMDAKSAAALPACSVVTKEAVAAAASPPKLSIDTTLGDDDPTAALPSILSVRRD